MEELPKCKKCGSEYTYIDGHMYVCPECAFEWAIEGEEEESMIVKDAHGNILQDGDSVSIIKDLKVKGASSPIKIGLKIKDIRIVEPVNGHNIEAKAKGIGHIMLKSEYVKKSS